MLQGEHSVILLTIIKLPFVIKIFVSSYFEWLPKTCFTVLITVLWSLLTRCKMFFISEIFSQLKWVGPLGPLPLKFMGHILKSWDNDPGPPLI